MINNAIFTKYYEAADQFIDNLYLGKAVKLYFITKKDCTNCNQNVYDGNIPFTNLCPYCEGKNYIEEETTKNIRLRVYTVYKDWIKVAGVEFVSGRAQVIGYISDMTSVEQCTKLDIFDGTGLGMTYKLATRCTPHGFGLKYFISHIDVYTT